MTEAEDRIACWAVGVRSRDDIQRLQAAVDKLASLTGPGEHDPLEVAARWKEVGKLVDQVRQNERDSVACGVPPAEFTESGEVEWRGKTGPGSIRERSWPADWHIYGEKLLQTPDPHARAVALSSQIPNVRNEMVWSTREVQRPGGSPPQGQVTLRMGPKGNYLFTPQSEEDLETAKRLEAFLRGEAKQEGGVTIVDHLYTDGALSPALSDALAHLRTTLAAVTAGSDTHVLIDWNEKARVVDVDGHADPYRGSTWSVQVTPNYTVQNQREIAEYVLHYEDAIAEEVRKLISRKRRMRGWKVEFYATHPGVQFARHIGVGPPETGPPARDSSYMLPDYHPECTYTPPDFTGRPEKAFWSSEPSPGPQPSTGPMRPRSKP